MVDARMMLEPRKYAISDQTQYNAASAELGRHVAEIVAAYVSNNAIPVSEVPSLIATIHSTLARLAVGGDVGSPNPKPVVPIKKSVTKDFIICLEDGRNLSRCVATC